MNNILDIDYAKQLRDYSAAVRHLLEKNGKAQPMAYVHSFGCQQNISDTEKIMGMLSQMGYGFASSPQNSDIVIFNTCAVRENAQKKVFSNIGELKALKEQKSDMIICVCGCMVQQPYVVEKLKKSYPYVDIIFGTHVLHTLPELVYTKLSTGQKHVISVADEQGEIAEDIPVRREGNLKAWVPIMYGCDNFCTYCIVPYTRGRERSRKPENILEEVEKLVSEGFKEITLLGQNVNSYGKGLKPEINFSELLRRICTISGDFRVRFMTSHPKDCTHELIDIIADNKKLCKSIHLPVQCGSNRILTAMNRGYSVEDYKELVSYARMKIPEIQFTTDIIVGFPGEEHEDFMLTAELIKEVKFEKLFTFIYSKRNGTKAAELDDIVPYKTKSDWLRELLDIQTEIGYDIYNSMLGKIQEVLVEGESKANHGVLIGRTDTNILTEFYGDKSLIGRTVKIKAITATKTAIKGEIVI